MTQFRITGLDIAFGPPPSGRENRSRKENYSSQGGKFVRELPPHERRDPYRTNYDAPRYGSWID